MAVLPMLALLGVAACSIEINKQPAPDSAAPDATTKPDARRDSRADGTAPDTGAPAKMLTDDTFSELHAGQLSESGARIHVTARGTVQLLESNDLNGDGHLDLVFANSMGSGHLVNSFLYWGSSAGFTATNRALLPGAGAAAVRAADLNGDGLPDLVLANTRDAKTHQRQSYIYWGSAAGYTAANRAGVPTLGAAALAVADLDRDGHLDLVLANSRDDKTTAVNSYVYWGSSVGLSAVKRLELPTLGARAVLVADLDADGRLDLVFANNRDGKSYKVSSYIYWGSASGYSIARRSELYTVGATGVAAADFNLDGWLDLVFANHGDGVTTKVNSFIYRGSKSGFSSPRESLPTLGATAVMAAQLNADGYLDLVFANQGDTKSQAVNSYVYWGSLSGFSITKRAALPTLGALDAAAADLNADGLPDLVFANGRSGSTSSYVYWGATSGYSAGKRSALPTAGAAGVSLGQPGSVHARKPVQTFTSRMLDTKLSSPSYTTLTVKATVPANTSLKLQLRSAASPTAMAGSSWYGSVNTSDHYNVAGKPFKVNVAHNGDRYIQYRAVFATDYGRSPVLDRVEIGFR